MKYLRNGLIRAIIPFTIIGGISLVLRFVEHNNIQARYAFFAAIIVASLSGFSVIYDFEKWSLLKQSAIHFICMLLTVFPCMLFAGWLKTETLLDYLKIFGLFCAGGVVFWLLAYMIFGKLLAKK